MLLKIDTEVLKPEDFILFSHQNFGDFLINPIVFRAKNFIIEGIVLGCNDVNTKLGSVISFNTNECFFEKFNMQEHLNLKFLSEPFLSIKKALENPDIPYFIRHKQGFYISESNNWKFSELLPDFFKTLLYILPMNNDKEFIKNFKCLEKDNEFKQRLLNTTFKKSLVSWFRDWW